MRFVVVLIVLAVVVVILNRLNTRRAADNATTLSAQFADKGWKAEAVGDRVDRTDLRVEAPPLTGTGSWPSPSTPAMSSPTSKPP